MHQHKDTKDNIKAPYAQVDDATFDASDDQQEGGSDHDSMRASVIDRKERKTKNTLVAALCTVAFLTMAAYAQLAPFFPLKAKEKGVSILWIGFIMGFFAIMQITSSTYFGKTMHKMKMPKHWLIIIGDLLLVVDITMLGLCDYIDDPFWFVFTSMIAQGIGGFGAGADMTACMSILSGFDGQERERSIGLIEASNGVGLLFGPLLGAALYSQGGYKVPFFTFAAIFVVILPCIMSALFKYEKMRKEIDEKRPKEKCEEKETVSLFVLFKKPRFCFGILAQMFVIMSVQFLAPNLAIQFQKFGYTPITIGCAYALPGVLYACTCPFIYILTGKIKKRGIIITGFIVIICAMQMIGGSDMIFEFQKQPVYIFLGLILMGLSAGMITIPVLPEMLETVEDDPKIMAKYDMESIENACSGLFITFQSIGEAGGPIFASTLAFNYGFQRAQEIFSGVLLFYFVLYFLVCGNFSMFGRETRYDTLEVLDQDEDLINKQEGNSGAKQQNF